MLSQPFEARCPSRIMDAEEASRLLIDEYSRMAEKYDAHAAPHNATLVQRLLELADVQPGERLLDLGCGTGNLAFEAVRRVGKDGRVAGVDLAERMVAFARRKAAEEDVRSASFEVMDCRRLSYEDASFDVVASCLGIPSVGHTLCLRQAYRVLRKGGRFVYCVGTGAGPVAEVLLAFREIFEKYRPPPRADVQRLIDARRIVHATGQPAEMRKPDVAVSQLLAAGFDVAETRIETFPMTLPTLDDYLRYRNAWGDNEREWREMEEEARKAIVEEFATHTDGSGRGFGFSYMREVLFLRASKGPS